MVKGSGGDTISNPKEKHHLHIELTPAQYQLLTSQAKRCGLSKRAFIIRLLESREIRTRPSQEIKELRTEIHHIGNNIKEPLKNSPIEAKTKEVFGSEAKLRR